MIAVPWYLLAGGIVLLIIGVIGANISQSSSGTQYIDPRMSDEDIAKNLQGDRNFTIPSVLIYLGLLCIVVSILWRVARLLF